MEEIEALERDLGEDVVYMMALRAADMDYERELQANSLLAFIRYFWKIVEPGVTMAEAWPLEAMCQHLEAVDRGEITRLLITVPPGSMKSLLCSVFFPLWQWGPRNKPNQRYLNFAYAAHLTQRDNDRMLMILKSPEWRELWGPRREKVWDEDQGKYIFIHKGFTLRAEGKEKIATSKTGWKLATSVGGVGTGERGNGIILDDPHSIKDDTSEVVRPETVRWMKEAMMNRLNDLERSWIIVIMQRSHEADCAGELINEVGGYVHLNIPAAYEREQHCTTYLQSDGPVSFDNSEPFWTDPRSVEGENYWPARLPLKEFNRLQKPANAHVWQSQYQQRPEPRGGAILKRDYWRPYVPKMKAGKPQWPRFEFVLGSLDSAFTEDNENDPSAFTAWGVFQDDEGSMCALLLMAWRKWLTLGGTKHVRRRRDDEPWQRYKDETSADWGITHWMRYECTRLGVDQLLIENKANGKDIYNELLKHTKFDKWSMTLVDPKNLDKLARINRVQPIFAEGLIYAILDKEYAKLAMAEAAVAPRGKYRDITDTITQALWYLRNQGYLVHVEQFQMQQQRAQERAGKDPKGAQPLYPA